jgi:ubiquitin-activating enzyme E1
MSKFIDNIPDHRYSRQSYSIGQDVQIKLSDAHILIIGYNTLSQEIIRNLALIGVAKIDIFINKNNIKYSSTGLYYPLINNELPLENLRKLNPTIKIDSINILDEDNELDKKVIKKYSIVILTNSILDDAININRITHKFNIPFIMCGTYGLTGYTFNDFGENFTINDIDGEISESLILENIDGKLLKFKDDHKLSQDDIIIITWSDGFESELKVFRKKSPQIVELTEIPIQDKNNYIKIIRKKISQIFNFESLKKNINELTHIIADWSVNTDQSKILHKLHLALDKYYNDFGSMPNSWSLSDFDIFKKKYLEQPEFESEYNIMLAKKFCFTVRGDILPICSIIGGIVSHEIIKVLAHKYIPITQWYYMDYLDLILDSEINEYDDYTSRNFKTKTKYDGLVNVFGKKFLENIQNTVPFIIGSGAIGCELIKNLGMMGVKQIYLTDPDHIEKSNLSRQFLFNDNDIRQSKAETASKKIKIMNPDININVYKEKMCIETENIFDNNFHSKIDIYLNALDNVEARNYMDSQALKYSKPLIDSGTMGSKGNIQVVIPHLTESYGSSKDPDEKAGIPICTIKAFPYKPEHTIQWARELFETEFNQIPNILNKYKNMNELNKINDSDAKQLLKQLYKYKNFNLTQNYYNLLLGTIYRENFYDNIKEINDKYLKEENKEELGDKKLPKYLNCIDDIIFNKFYYEFMEYGYKLLNQIFNSCIEFNTNSFKNNNEILYESFKYEIDELNSEQIIEILFPIINLIPNLNSIEFEKDDDELGHVQWIGISANMRNIQYSITQIDLYETRKIAGNIIPALITTTSLISGFQILEYIRICKLYTSNKYLNIDNQKDINNYKNRFVNLNTNYCDGINPSYIKTFQLYNGKNITSWSNFKITTTETTQLINQIESETKKKIEFITHGNKTVYDGDDINIHKIDLFDKNSVLILLEDIPIGIPIMFI